MKVSVIIPFMNSFEGKEQILKTCTDSFIGVDELIIVSNWREGYAKPINRGLRLAKGDYLFVMNDDLVWDGGSIKRVCRENAVTSPQINGKSQSFWGCCFCIPRWVYEKIGGLDERYEISYFDDDDYWNTLKQNNIPHYCIDSVSVQTKGGTTLDKLPDRDEFFEKNKLRFIEKWGKLPS